MSGELRYLKTVQHIGEKEHVVGSISLVQLDRAHMSVDIGSSWEIPFVALDPLQMRRDRPIYGACHAACRQVASKALPVFRIERKMARHVLRVEFLEYGDVSGRRSKMS